MAIEGNSNFSVITYTKMGHKRQKIPTVHNTKISRAKEGIDSKDLKDYFKVLFHTTVEIVVIVSTSCKVA